MEENPFNDKKMSSEKNEEWQLSKLFYKGYPYILWVDFETTGLSPSKDRIIQWGAQLSRGDEKFTLVDSWSTFIRPVPWTPIPNKVQEITGIRPNQIYGKQATSITFSEAYDQFKQWLHVTLAQDARKVASTRTNNSVGTTATAELPPHVWMAHNGLRFDYAMFWCEVQRLVQQGAHAKKDEVGQQSSSSAQKTQFIKQTKSKLEKDFPTLTHWMDSIHIAKSIVPCVCKEPCPPKNSYALGNLYKWLHQGQDIPDAHDARGDVNAMRSVLYKLKVSALWTHCAAAHAQKKQRTSISFDQTSGVHALQPCCQWIHGGEKKDIYCLCHHFFKQFPLQAVLNTFIENPKLFVTHHSPDSSFSSSSSCSTTTSTAVCATNTQNNTHAFSGTNTTKFSCNTTTSRRREHRDSTDSKNAYERKKNDHQLGVFSLSHTKQTESTPLLKVHETHEDHNKGKGESCCGWCRRILSKYFSSACYVCGANTVSTSHAVTPGDSCPTSSSIIPQKGDGYFEKASRFHVEESSSGIVRRRLPSYRELREQQQQQQQQSDANNDTSNHTNKRQNETVLGSPSENKQKARAPTKNMQVL